MEVICDFFLKIEKCEMEPFLEEEQQMNPDKVQELPECFIQGWKASGMPEPGASAAFRPGPKK